MNLPPPLPEAITVSPPGSSFQATVLAYTADQLRDYGAACYAAGMDAAAELCDEVAHNTNLSPRARCASELAEAIRAAMPPKP